MSKPSAYVLIWVDEREQYELYLHGQLHQCFQRGDDDAFSRWLEAHTAFAFVGQSERISALKEFRPGGTSYWYAYRTNVRQTRKRYLGSSANVTFARLEQEAKALSGSPSDHRAAPGHAGKRTAASPQAEQRETLLSLRLAPPRLPGSLVERPRLFGELDAAFSHPLTLVSAAAGSGKTTLLSTWVAASPQVLPRGETKRSAERRGSEPAFAWLSLDEPDNDPIRFWLSVIAAVQTCLPTCGATARELLRSPQAPPLSTVLTTLLDEMAQVQRDILLILDDYHVISDQTIHDSLLALLDHPPANLHLVLVSRTNPTLPLSRFRVRSQLLEIRDQDLRFTQQEATSFLVEEMGLPLSEGEVTTLATRTEGWIAGLQLAALSLRKRQDLSAAVADFGGSHRYLLDYVQQDILVHLPQTLQNFLLQTSVLTRMNAALCQMVTAAPDERACQQMLEELERTNLFVVPLDDQRHWYRLHELFREALRARLYASQPRLVPLLHRRAASFYEARGEWAEALAHWFSARDFSTAANLMEQTGEQFWVRGEAATMARWVLELPNVLVCEHASLALTTALYLLNTVTQTTGERRARVHSEVRQLMARVETALRRERDATNPPFSIPCADAGAAFCTTEQQACASEEAVLHRRLRLLHLCMATSEAIARGEFECVSGMQQEMQELDRDEEVIWQMIPLAHCFFLQCRLQPETALLVPRLLSAKEQVSQSGSHFANVKVSHWLAVAALKTGRLHLAYEEGQAALDLIEQIKGSALFKGCFEQVLAAVCYHWNRLEEARGRLRTAIQGAATWQQLDLLLSGYTALMLVELARGDLSGVDLLLYECEQQEGATHYRCWLSAIRARWWLAQEQIREASDWAASFIFPDEPWESSRYFAFPVVIKVYFAQQRWREALELLDHHRAHLDRPANIKITIPYLSQLLVALHQTGQRKQAREVAARLFALTEPEGYLRVYLDEGELMRQALLAWLTSHSGQHQQTSSPTAYVSRVLAAFEQEEQQLPPGKEAWPATMRKTLPHFPYKADPHLPLEPLSPQEQRVLRLLVAGQTYAEMAQTLVVSPNTIKTHVGCIYRKLGVRHRAEAIAMASRLHRLSFE